MIRPTTTDEAVMLLWDRLFGNGIEGAVPGIQRSLEDLRTGQKVNYELIVGEKERLTNYILTRAETCPLVAAKERRGQGTARLLALVFGANGALLGIAMLILKVARVI